MALKVFVIGATGTTGGATVRALRAADVDVIAGVRSIAKSGHLDRLGAVVKQVAIEDVASMTIAMRGADRLFLVTPVTQATAALTAMIVEAATAAGIRHIAKLSGLDVDAEPSFTFGRWHRDAEKLIEASGIDWTFLRPNNFMQNFFFSAESIKSQGTYYSPFGSAAISHIDARDIGEVAVKVLSTDGHAGKIYRLTGPRAITEAEACKQLSLATGKPVTCIPVTIEQAREGMVSHGMAPVVADATAELLGRMATGTASAVLPDAARLLGRPPRDFAQFANDFSSVFRSESRNQGTPGEATTEERSRRARASF